MTTGMYIADDDWHKHIKTETPILKAVQRHDKVM
jgi:hypothetical protein